MDRIKPAFFSLKKICSRNSEETFSSAAMEPMEMGLLWLDLARLMTARSPYRPLVVILIPAKSPLPIYYCQEKRLSTS